MGNLASGFSDFPEGHKDVFFRCFEGTFVFFIPYNWEGGEFQFCENIYDVTLSPNVDCIPYLDNRSPTCEFEMSRIPIRSDDNEYIYTISREEGVIHIERKTGTYNQEWFKFHGGFLGIKEIFHPDRAFLTYLKLALRLIRRCCFTVKEDSAKPTF